MSILTTIQNNAISIEQFNKQWNERVQSGMKGLTVDQRKTLMHRKYNLDRRENVFSSYKPSPELLNVLENLNESYQWYVITEDWCGDSSFNLAVIESIAKLTDKIELKIVERDNELSIIDSFLTNGGRAIPILLSFNENGDQLFKWGPRPQNQIDYRVSLVEQGLEKLDITNKVIEAYDNGAWKHVETELAALLQK